MGRPSRIARRVLMSSICVGMAFVGLGCANGALRLSQGPSSIMEPAGPGTVFATIDEAAVDGLAYSYHKATQLDGGQSALGGTVYRVAHGYSYEVPRVVPQPDPDRVQIVLNPRDVAHFATYPKGSLVENRMNESHSHHDRRNVDKLDPLHRPAFILTPSLDVKSYMGTRSEFVASIVAVSSGAPASEIASTR